MAKKIKNTKKVGRCSCCKAKKVSLVPDLGIAICKRCALYMAFALVRNDVLDDVWDDQPRDTCVACCSVGKVTSGMPFKICDSCVGRMNKIIWDEKQRKFSKSAAGDRISFDIRDLSIIVHKEIAKISQEKGVGMNKIEDAFFYQYRMFYPEMLEVDIKEKEDPNNLINYLYARDGLIVTDPKGEFANANCDLVKRNGYKVFHLDLANYKNGDKVTMSMFPDQDMSDEQG